MTDDLKFKEIELAFKDKWEFGKNIVLCWTVSGNGIDYLAIPYYLTGIDLLEDTVSNSGKKNNISFHEIIKGSRFISRSLFDGLEKQYEITRDHIKITVQDAPHDEFIEKIDELVRKFSITYNENHAVALFDIVGFSKYIPIDQVTQLNSLSYSINSAYRKLGEQGIDIEFARTTTGDGFYVWTRKPTIESNVNLYSLVQLILANNAISRTKSYGQTAPLLKTAFHIGNYYEFYQSESLRPTSYTFIVGDVTIELARLVESAEPGQILVGDFSCHLPSIENPDEYIHVNTIEYIKLLEDRIQELKDIRISGKRINKIMCYLTGNRIDEDKYTISRYRVVDKHKFSRYVYNAKVNIYRGEEEPIYLGLQNKEVKLTSSTT